MKTLKFTYNWNEIKNISSKHSLFPAFCIPGWVMFVYSLKRFLINRTDAKQPIRVLWFNEFIKGRFDQYMRIMPKRTWILVPLFIKSLVCSFWEAGLCLFTFTFWPIEAIVTTHSWRVKFQLHSFKTKFEIINSIKRNFMRGTLLFHSIQIFGFYYLS